MAREARKISPAGLYVVELNGDRLFQNDDDKRVFVETAEKYFADGGRIYGYLLTDTSAKMAVKESGRGISMAMKSLTVSYARYYNKTHEISGALFSGRFKSVPLYSEAEAVEAAKDLDAPAPKAAKPAEKAAPKAAKKPTPKAAVKKSVPKSTAKKPAPKAAAKPAEKSAPKPAEPAEIHVQDAPKPKKKSLPSWLL